jgi:hypothetical protein
MKHYISLIVNGDIVNQVEIPGVFESPEIDPRYSYKRMLEDMVIGIDTMLRKAEVIDEDTEIALTEDI